jgi:hypothetical protein
MNPFSFQVNTRRKFHRTHGDLDQEHSNGYAPWRKSFSEHTVCAGHKPIALPLSVPDKYSARSAPAVFDDPSPAHLRR